MPRTRSQPLSPSPRPAGVAWERLPELPPRLTPPQRELLPLLVTELSYKRISDAMGMKLENLKGQVRRLYRKLGTRTRHAALIRWLRPDLYPNEYKSPP